MQKKAEQSLRYLSTLTPRLTEPNVAHNLKFLGLLLSVRRQEPYLRMGFFNAKIKVKIKPAHGGPDLFRVETLLQLPY